MTKIAYYSDPEFARAQGIIFEEVGSITEEINNKLEKEGLPFAFITNDRGFGIHHIIRQANAKVEFKL